MKLQESDGRYHTKCTKQTRPVHYAFIFDISRGILRHFSSRAPPYLAVLRPGHVGLEVHLQPGELELRPLQRLPQRLVVVRDGGLGALAEGQGEVRVGLLPVVVRAHRVHPEDHLLAVLVLGGKGKKWQ